MKKLISIVLLLVLVVGCNKRTPIPVLNILNFGDYINPELVEQFSNENKCIVKVDLFESNEDALGILNKDTNNYDLVCLSEYAVKQLIEQDKLEPITVTPSEVSLYTGYLNSIHINMSKYAIPYFMGSQGICYNETQITKRDYPVPNSWNDLSNPAYVDQLVMPNNIRDLYTCALYARGFSSNTTKKEEIDIATQDLIDQKPLVQAYCTDQIKDKLASGECLIAPMFSGDYQYLVENSNDKFTYLLPSGRKSIFIDCWCIPKNNNRKEIKKELTNKFLGYIYEKENYKSNAKYVGYESCFEGVDSLEYMDIFKNIIDLSNPNMVELEDSLADAITLYNDGFNLVKGS